MKHEEQEKKAIIECLLGVAYRKEEIKNLKVNDKKIPIWEGEIGELLTGVYMYQNGVKVEYIEQRVDNKNRELKALGGKRPDFIHEDQGLLNEGYIETIDSKHVKLYYKGQSYFILSDEELTKYKNLCKHLMTIENAKHVNVVFIVWPKNDLGKVYLVPLEVFEDCNYVIKDEEKKTSRVLVKGNERHPDIAEGELPAPLVKIMKKW
ncbi:hypothetical protein VCHA50O407_230074 [Vibrio chagasii]|nr:hypothetical protein VCHA50P424_140075 [Vibrio chagasii]CAH7152174.1 hypothetical protein VCHA50O407_230074 [Vibrio chagasii]